MRHPFTRQMRSRPKQRRLGYGLLEIALGIAIAALLIAGAMLYYQNSIFNKKLKESVEYITYIMDTVNTMYNGQPTYVGLSTLQVYNSISIAKRYKQYKNDDYGIMHPFNGKTSIYPGPANAYYYVRLMGLKRDSCIQLATKDFGNAIVHFRINSTTFPRYPITMEQAFSVCQDISTPVENGNNQIAWGVR